MKRILCVVFIGVMIVLLGKESYFIIPDEAIRFRIIPNSNSAKDVIMKEKVQNEITDIIDNIQSDNIDDSRKNILKNIDNVERRINKVFEDNNYDMPYKVNYGLNEFPEKIYKGVKYEEGKYESLVVEIGDAKGDNFWCVLYPPLCMIDESDSEVNYKFKVVEIFEKFFEK